MISSTLLTWPTLEATTLSAAEPPYKSPPGVFPWSDDWFRSVTEFAQNTPSWVQEAVAVGTEAGLLLFAVLFLAAWWRARGRGSHQMALALLAPLVTVGAYGLSEAIKSQALVVRPCRAVAHVQTIADCPPLRDWSFPSNHATVVAAASAAVLLAWRALAYIALPAAALMAFSRVFVGLHFPLDVIAGFLLGATVAPLLSLALARLLAPLVERLRAYRPLRPLLAE